MQNNTRYIEENQINLGELFSVLKRRKKLIWLVTTLFTLLALIYVFMAKPVYEVKSNVEIGFIDENLVVDSATLEKRLKLVFNVEGKQKIGKEFVSSVSGITTNKKLKNFIEIKTEAISNEEGLKKNKEVVKYTQDLYREKIDQYILDTNNSIQVKEKSIVIIDKFEIKNINEEIEILQTQRIPEINDEIKFYKNIELVSLERKIKLHTEKLKEYTQAINDLYKKGEEEASRTTSSIQMANYQSLILNSQDRIETLELSREKILNKTIINLQQERDNINNKTIKKLEYQAKVTLGNEKEKYREEIVKLKNGISKQNLSNSRVVGEYIIQDHPVKPKKLLIVIVAFITGLMLSVFLAFFLEFLQGTKEEETE